MKTEGGTGDMLWNTNVDLHLTHEECLPEIGTTQITSLLTNIGNNTDKSTENNEIIHQNVDLVVLNNSKDKEPVVQNSITDAQNLNNVIIFEDIPSNDKEVTEKPKKLRSSEDNYEDMLYFVCNLCPFLCTKATKITEHLETLHKSNSVSKPLTLKCPACANTFYHKISLRSHLVHDHQVGSSDLRKILQAVIYYAKKNNNNNLNNSKKNVPLQKVSNSAQLNYKSNSESDVERVINLENIVANESITSDNDTPQSTQNIENESLQSSLQFLTPKLQTNNDKEPLITNLVNAPITSASLMDSTQQCADKIVLSNVIKNQILASKCLEQNVFHKCTILMCKVRLRDLTKMFYHIKCHVENGFKCLECDQTFSYWKPLTGHLWRVHKIDMELYACDKCDYKTFSLGKLNTIHKLIHNEAKPYICDICSKGFKNSKQLRNHKIKHKEFPNKTVQLCMECNKTFSDKRQLRIHMDSVHKKLKPFLCNYCGYKGASKSSLKMHIRQHTGEKPFACNSCSYTTADHNSLRRHKLRHTGHKPYKCLYCEYACIQSSTFKIHLKTKHPGLEKNLMFACQDCQFRTVNKDMYLSHVSTVHKKTVYV